MLIGIFAVLFGVAYITRRRFGVLGLGLAAGALVSGLWARDLVPLVEQSDIDVASLSAAGLSAAILVILPSLLLLLRGPSYKPGLMRIFGALLYAAMALVLLVEPLGAAFVLDGVWIDVYAYVTENSPYIVTTLLIIALLDALGINSRAARMERKHHNKKHH